MADFIVRKFRVADLGPVTGVFRRATRFGTAGAYTLRQRVAWSSRFRGVARRRRKLTSGGICLVAESAGRVVGFTYVTPAGHVDMLFTDPARTRRGIAGGLLQAALQHCRRRGIGRFDTFASRLSRPVFERAGFRVAGHELRQVAASRLFRSRMVLRETGGGA